MVIFNTSNKELELIEAENNFLDDKKSFIKMFRDNVKNKHDFLAINYSNEYEELYLDKNFEVIKHK